MTSTFSVTHRVQFSETDMAGVAHFSNFFRWMEETEHAFLRSVGVGVSITHNGATIGWPRVNATCDFMHPARFEDEVRCELAVQRIGEGSITHEVTFTVHGELIARGSMTIACCTLVEGTMRSIPIPLAIRARLSGG
ncbi:MAG: acyl-CoA thioesterase [Phycisphaerales bacterium]|nr:acyl-CoA thioesterase [Phycisphaerales bacterium]